MPFDTKGITDLEEHLRKFRQIAFQEVCVVAVNAGLDVIEKAMMSEVPTAYSSMSQFIGKRIVRELTNESSQTITGRIGFGVAGGSGAGSSGRTTKGGVGIGMRNLHWAIYGTGPRWTKKKHAFRGSMPAIISGVVSRGYNKSSDASKAEMLRVVRQKVHEKLV